MPEGFKKTIMALVLGVIIAAGGYFTKAYTLDEAIEIAMDADKSSLACEELLSGKGYAIEAPEPSEAPVE